MHMPIFFDPFARQVSYSSQSPLARSVAFALASTPSHKVGNAVATHAANVVPKLAARPVEMRRNDYEEVRDRKHFLGISFRPATIPGIAPNHWEQFSLLNNVSFATMTAEGDSRCNRSICN